MHALGRAEAADQHLAQGRKAWLGGDLSKVSLARSQARLR